MASIQKRSSKGKVVYRVRWRDPAGRQVSRQFPTLAAARAHQVTVEADMLRGSYVDPTRGQMTVAEYATAWLEVQTFGLTTRVRREQSIRLHIVPHLGSYRLAAVRPSMIQAWIKLLSAQLGPRTVRETFRLLLSVLESAVEDERIAKNPCRSSAIRVPKPDEKVLVPWTSSQIAALHEALPPRYRPLLLCAAGLGLRQGEIFGLAVSDIDFPKKVLTVRRQVTIVNSRLIFALPKGRKVRTVPLPPSVAEELARYIQEFPVRTVALPMTSPDSAATAVDLLLTSREGKALNRNYVNCHVWKPALRRAGLPDTRDFMTHGGRHFYASLQLEAGVSPKALADYLGHADPAFMLRTYAHLMPGAEQKVHVAVDNMIAAVRHAARGQESALG